MALRAALVAAVQEETAVARVAVVAATPASRRREVGVPVIGSAARVGRQDAATRVAVPPLTGHLLLAAFTVGEAGLKAGAALGPSPSVGVGAARVASLEPHIETRHAVTCVRGAGPGSSPTGAEGAVPFIPAQRHPAP